MVTESPKISPFALNTDGEDFEKSDSIGSPQWDVEAKINKNTKEVLIRGPFVKDGYYKNEKMTNSTIIDRWLHTRDKGFLDDDNYL